MRLVFSRQSRRKDKQSNCPARIKGMNPKAGFENPFSSRLRGIIPSAVRDCSTYQFPNTSLWKLEFHNEMSRRALVNFSSTVVLRLISTGIVFALTYKSKIFTV